MPAKITIYSLATCSHCNQAKAYLDEREVPYDTIHMDFLSGDDRTRAMDALRKLNPEITFPTIIIGENVVVGFRPEAIEAALKAGA